MRVPMAGGRSGVRWGVRSSTTQSSRSTRGGQVKLGRPPVHVGVQGRRQRAGRVHHQQVAGAEEPRQLA